MKLKSISDLQIILRYKDLRAVRAWCLKNKVAIIKQGKHEFVYEGEFNYAFDQPIIKRYKLQYGHDWERAYNLLKEDMFMEIDMMKRVPETTNRSRRRFNTG